MSIPLEMTNGPCRHQRKPTRARARVVPCPLFISSRAVPARYTCLSTRARVCACAHTCCVVGRAVPRKNSPLTFFSFFFKSACQVVFLFFFQSYVLFWIHVSLLKFNRIKNSNSSPYSIIIGECNISC